MGPYPTWPHPCKKRRFECRDRYVQREVDMKTLENTIYKARECLRAAAAAGDRPGTEAASQLQREPCLLRTPAFRLPCSRMVRSYTFAIWATQFVVLCHDSSRKQTQAWILDLCLWASHWAAQPSWQSTEHRRCVQIALRFGHLIWS